MRLIDYFNSDYYYLVITSLTTSTKPTKIKRRSSRKALGCLVVADALRDVTIIVRRSHLMFS